jgi:4-diphosphocytidyl-2-C-methyl-D-erythritol kinase
LRLDAWAKVNLTLHVTGRRADGYHELDSLIVFAGIGDTLEIAADDDLTLTLSGPGAHALEPEADNLVLRAARALSVRFGVQDGAALHLVKRLPIAAGLGGGSADAAAALRGLNAHWNLGASAEVLHEIAAGLGADVPVCLYGKACYVSGIGERIEPAGALPEFGLVLVNPGVPLSTPAVFRARAGAFASPHRPVGDLRDLDSLVTYLRAGRNDLEPAARRLVPEIDRVLEVLGAVPGCRLARMSGSGATCFGLFGDARDARAAAARISAARTAWWVSAAPIAEA